MVLKHVFNLFNKFKTKFEDTKMQVDIEHVLFWMDAIRNSDDRYRTLESFWKGQVNSKLWLIDQLMSHVPSIKNNIVIHGGWNGVLASLLFQSTIETDNIVSIDIDPACEEISRTMNKIEDISGKFKAVTCNMIDYQYDKFPNIVINTSCEHISQEDYDKWLKKIPNGSIIVLQSNDYFQLDEHIRCANSLEEFTEQSKIKIYSSEILKLPKYNRFMLIGTR
jgi:hypothetical protein